MLNKLQLHDQTTQIQFQLLRKELQNSKADAESRNRLQISLFQELCPEFRTSASVEEMIARLQQNQLAPKQGHCCKNNDGYTELKQDVREIGELLRIQNVCFLTCNCI